MTEPNGATFGELPSFLIRPERVRAHGKPPVIVTALSELPTPAHDAPKARPANVAPIIFSSATIKDVTKRKIAEPIVAAIETERQRIDRVQRAARARHHGERA